MIGELLVIVGVALLGAAAVAGIADWTYRRSCRRYAAVIAAERRRWLRDSTWEKVARLATWKP